MAETLIINTEKTEWDEVKGSEYETIVVKADSTIGKITADPAVNFINVQANLTVNSNVETNQINVNQYKGDDSLTVNGDLTVKKSLTITSTNAVNVSGTTTLNGGSSVSQLTNTAKLTTDKLIINGHTMLSGGGTIVANEIEVNHTLSPTAGSTIKSATGSGGVMRVNTGGHVWQQACTIDMETVVKGGEMTMYSGNYKGITLEEGSLHVKGTVTTGALTLNGGQLNFSAGSVLDLNGEDLILGENVAITLKVDSLDNIEKVSLFKSTGNVFGVDKGTVTFVDSTDTEKEVEVIFSNGYAILYTENYVAEHVNTTTRNGDAAVAMLTEVFLNESLVSGSALRSILDTVHAGTFSDRDAAAVVGVSTAVLGQALSGDVDRQLRAIRNRSSENNFGSSHAVALDGKGGLATMPQDSRYFAWVNAEGNRAEQDADGTAAGYSLSSWGATVGAGMQVNNQLTLGLALTAMYGDLKSDGPDNLDGDMDTTYVSAFARYLRGRWSHALIGTVGTMDADYIRTAMNYSNDGDTDGTACGLMYELSRNYTLSNTADISPVFNIAYRHTEVDGYSESGTDAALNVGKQSLDTVTVGLGARYAAVVGQQMLNRDCGFEARALVKYDFGDTQTDTTVGFINHATRANIESAEMGAFGVELGAGISVPVGSGSIFTDGAMELRSDYTNFNATVGYKIQF